MAMPSALATPFRGLQGSSNLSKVIMKSIREDEKQNMIMTRLHLCFSSILTERSR